MLFENCALAGLKKLYSSYSNATGSLHQICVVLLMKAFFDYVIIAIFRNVCMSICI